MRGVESWRKRGEVDWTSCVTRTVTRAAGCSMRVTRRVPSCWRVALVDLERASRGAREGESSAELRRLVVAKGQPSLAPRLFAPRLGAHLLPTGLFLDPSS